MLLDFDHLRLAEAWFVRLVIHLEELDLFQPIRGLPSHRLGLLFGLDRLILGQRVLVEGVISSRIVQIDGLVVD